jgi:hypothetical protein
MNVQFFDDDLFHLTWWPDDNVLEVTLNYDDRKIAEVVAESPGEAFDMLPSVFAALATRLNPHDILHYRGLEVVDGGV